VTSEQSTRIEAYFFQGSIASPFQTHVAELLRLVAQDLHEVTARDPITSYAEHIARTMWLFGGHGGLGGDDARMPQYDTANGKPFFFQKVRNDLDLFPSIFKVDQFLGRKERLCNCYDLAGIIEICCKALGNRAAGPGEEKRPVSSVWVLPYLLSQ